MTGKQRPFTRNTGRAGAKLSVSGDLYNFQEDGINPYIWCVVGALIGGLACLLMKISEKIIIIETVGVAVFGAYIGGDFVAALLSHGASNDKDFSAGSLGLAIAGSAVMLLALRLMRKAVGPQHQSKGPRRRD